MHTSVCVALCAIINVGDGMPRRWWPAGNAMMDGAQKQGEMGMWIRACAIGLCECACVSMYMHRCVCEKWMPW